MTMYHCHAPGCRFKTTSWTRMAKHSRTKHPNRMKRKTTKPQQSKKSAKAGLNYCPCCGREM